MALTLSKLKMSLEILLTTDSSESLLRHVTNPELLNSLFGIRRHFNCDRDTET